MTNDLNATNYDERLKKLEKRLAKLEKDVQSLNKKVNSLDVDASRQRETAPTLLKNSLRFSIPFVRGSGLCN